MLLPITMRVYHEERSLRPLLDGISYNSISIDDALDLEMGFSKEEGWNAINDLGKEIASGPDDFNIPFFEHCWNVVKGTSWVSLLTFVRDVLSRKA